jgi:hypothetical protein
VRNTWPRGSSEIVITATVKATMFSNLTNILTMTAMLLHAVLGCCAHHAHACEHGSSAEECQAGHVEHHEHASEVNHSCHHEADDSACGSVADDAERESRGVINRQQEVAHEDHESSPHPEGPCQQNCDGGDCRFTQSPEVKTPSLQDGRLCCPSLCAAFSTAASFRFAAESLAAESRPPRALTTGCRRPMTQVWRL